MTNPKVGQSNSHKAAAPRPQASSSAARKRMQSTPRRDTTAELRVRRRLHSMGLRYTVDSRPLLESPRRADVVFRRARVAVFVDGCFWHGCPDHGTWPRANGEFWRAKIAANLKRDADTNERLQDRGWLAIRVWEHEDPQNAAKRIAQGVRSRIDTASQSRKAKR